MASHILWATGRKTDVELNLGVETLDLHNGRHLILYVRPEEATIVMTKRGPYLSSCNFTFLFIN